MSARKRQKVHRDSAKPSTNGGDSTVSGRPGSRTSEASAGTLSPGRLLAIRGLLALAFGISAYLAFLSLTGSQAVGCGPESGCDKVLASRWSSWFRVPVSLLALVVDGSLLAATFRLPKQTNLAGRIQVWRWLVPGAVLVAGAALWFIALQLFVIHSICPYCMTAHAAGLTAAILLLTGGPSAAAASSLRLPAPKSPNLIGVSLLGVIGLVAGQLVYAPKSFVVQTIPTVSTNAGPTEASTTKPLRADPVPSSNALSLAMVSRTSEKTPTTSTAPPKSAPLPVPPPNLPSNASAPNGIVESMGTMSNAGPRMFPVYNGRYFVDVSNLPTLGASTNAQVMVALHDFTCHYCRSMHHILADVQQSFSNKLVVVTLPMPFDPVCNPIMQRPNPKHTNACQYARLSMAVWRADRTKQHGYDEYLFTGTEVPSVAEARRTAEALVGAAALDRALADPWVEQQIRLGISLYEVAYRSGQGSMPQFLIGQNVAVGTLTKSDLLGLIERNFGLVAPAPPP